MHFAIHYLSLGSVMLSFGLPRQEFEAQWRDSPGAYEKENESLWFAEYIRNSDVGNQTCACQL
jgi:hypothetical protein